MKKITLMVLPVRLIAGGVADEQKRAGVRARGDFDT
jgi:hypothetical protein